MGKFSLEKGESPILILNTKSVSEIVELLKTTKLTQKEIAIKYNLHRSVVTDINTGKSWSWLTHASKEHPIRTEQIRHGFEKGKGKNVKFTCPRRLDFLIINVQPFEVNADKDGPDTYNPTCTYCGSLPGPVFMKMVKQNAKLLGSDKSYKVYIKFKDKTHKFYWHHLTQLQRDKFFGLYQEKKLNLDSYGLYVLPFFFRTMK